MKCNWLGKTVIENGAGPAKYSLVVLTPKTLDDQMKIKISEIAGIALLDVKLRFHADGFFILSRAGDAATLGAIAKTLKADGISSLIFDESKMFDVPELASAATCRIDGDKLVFLPKGSGDVTIFGKYARLLVVNARIEETSINSSTNVRTNTLSPYGTVMPTTSIFTSKTTQIQKISVTAVYDMIGNSAVKICEGHFNFKELLKENTQYDYKSNFEAFLSEAIKIVSHIFVDNSFSHSSLPLAHSEKHVFHSHSRFLASSGTHAESSEMNVFDQYTRFRYIVEQRMV
jgi:hypothetical protein